MIFKGTPWLNSIIEAILTKLLDSVDVFIQDQTTPPIDFFFTQIKSVPTTLAVAVAFDAYQITVTDGTSCAVGDYVGIFNADEPDNNRAYFGTILSKPSTHVINLDTPIDFNFQIGDTTACFSRNLNNANGSIASPQIYSLQVGSAATQSIDITRLMFSFTTATPVSLVKFGDIEDGLVNGCVLRRVNGVVNNIFNIKNNGELGNLCFDYTPYEAINPSQGQDGAKFRYSFAGQDKHGVAIRLAPGDSLQLIIQDDLTSISEFRVIGEGHYVDP